MKIKPIISILNWLEKEIFNDNSGLGVILFFLLPIFTCTGAIVICPLLGISLLTAISIGLGSFAWIIFGMIMTNTLCIFNLKMRLIMGGATEEEKKQLENLWQQKRSRVKEIKMSHPISRTIGNEEDPTPEGMTDDEYNDWRAMYGGNRRVSNPPNVDFVLRDDKELARLDKEISQYIK